MKPFLSIAVRAYNQEKEVLVALESVISQNFNYPVEIVVGIDRSTDNTLKAVTDFKNKLNDSQITIVIRYHNNHLGGAKNFVDLLINCHGKYIATLDGDDFWIDNDKCNKEISIMERDPSIGLVYTDLNISANGIQKLSKAAELNGNTFSLMLLGNPLSTCTVMFRSSLISYVDWEVLKKNNWAVDDYFTWLEFSVHTKFQHLSDTTAVYVCNYTELVKAKNIDALLGANENYRQVAEIKSYYISKYPKLSRISKQQVWDVYYYDKFHSGVQMCDYSYTLDAINHISNIHSRKT